MSHLTPPDLEGSADLDSTPRCRLCGSLLEEKVADLGVSPLCIPIFAPEKIDAARPDYVLMILPWNLKDEIAPQLEGIRAWGGRFVAPIPSVQVF